MTRYEMSNQSEAAAEFATNSTCGYSDTEERRRARHSKILLIDDDDDQRLVFEALLSEAGFQVVPAQSAFDALRVMRHLYIHAVVTDLKMPDMDGYDFISALRAERTLPRTARIPIILLTACSGDLELASIHMGADMFCEKRFASVQLIKQLDYLLDFL